MRFVSYAKEMEDLLIWITLKAYVKKGNYIDVGANDPVYLSVTKSFYDIGWSRINIEPLPDMCAFGGGETKRCQFVSWMWFHGKYDESMGLRNKVIVCFRCFGEP